MFARDPVESAHSAASDADGWTVFDDLPEGRFRLLLTPEGDEHVVTITDPFDLKAGEETVLDRLQLPAPAEVDVYVNIASLEVAEDTSLSVSANASSSCGWLSGASSKVAWDGSGSARFSGLHPGTWWFALEITPPDDPDNARPVAVATAELASGERATVLIEPQAVLFRGEVVDEGRPVEGELRIMAPSDSYITTTSTNESGEFSVALPEPGRYGGRRERRGDLR